MNLDKIVSQAWAELEKKAPNVTFEKSYRAHKLGVMFIKLTMKQQRDFDLYVNGQDAKRYKTINFLPNTSAVFYSARTIHEWFWLWDTHGLSVKLNDWRLSEAIKQEKEFINLTIKMWVEDVLKELIYVWEVWEWAHNFPSWVWESFAGQLTKMNPVFTFQKIHYAPDGKTYWEPRMLGFDAGI